MPEYLTRLEFEDRLARREYDSLVSDHIFSDQVPFAFKDSPADYDRLVAHLAPRLGVDDTQIKMVGSARTGFSLTPDRWGAIYSEASDLDVLVVSELIFDEIWLHLLNWHREIQAALTTAQGQRISDAKRDIYWGRLWPSKLYEITDHAQIWFEAFSSLAQVPQLAAFEASGRLYRTLRHAELAQRWNLSEIVRMNNLGDDQ